MVAKVQCVRLNDFHRKSKKTKLPQNVHLLAQEVRIIKSLAGNDPKQRQHQLKKLNKWFSLRSKSSFPFSDDHFMRIWKGLYYCMWMADKPLYQEELAEDLGKLIGSFSNIENSIKFFGTFLQTMILEWFGIDQFRMDKFLMLVRRMFRYIFHELKKTNWAIDSIQLFNSKLESTIFDANGVDGLIMHSSDVFLEELAKVAAKTISEDAAAEFIKPFVTFIARENNYKLIQYVQSRVFHHWLWQSKKGREQSEKFNAWKEMSFPTEDLNDIEKVEDDEDKEIENNESSVFDPRAGNVDVFIPELPVDVSPIIKIIEDIMFKESTNRMSRKFLRSILQKYKDYLSGEFPLGIKKIPKPHLVPYKPLLEEKIQELEKLDEQLFSTTRVLKKFNKKKRKRILASLDFSEANEDNIDELLKQTIESKTKSLSKNSWFEEEIEVPKKKAKLENIIQSGQIEQQEKSECLEEDNQWLESVADGDTKNVENEMKSSILENQKQISDWEKPLQEGEIEYFIPSRKQKLKDMNKALNEVSSKNPVTERENQTPVAQKVLKKEQPVAHLSKTKKVKIVLQKNMSQKPSDYIQQVRSSPQLPFDSQKMPSKSLLKPNLLPSPINPFYKRKIGLELAN